MRELAKACGMTIGAPYNYIGSKEDILHEVLREFENEALILEPFYKDLGGLATAKS